MKVKVKYFASYRELTGRREEEVDVPEGTTIDGLWRRIVENHAALASGARPWMAAALNKDYVPPDAALKDGDEVVFMPPVSGGAEIYEITDEELVVEPLIDAVLDPETGAVVVFVGTVRNHSGNKPVAALEYEAYAEMAEPKLAEIGKEIHERWDVRSVAIRHRTGRMEVGVASVVIAVSSSHREEAFAASKYAIERIKQVVPIWKKEIGPDGDTWV